MSRIKAKDTRPEMTVRRFLHANGFRYRLHNKKLPGKPDIVLPKYKTVIFINGCFWHGHQYCKYFVIPKTRTDWWISKINGNTQNDITKHALLKSEGWRVIILWECMLKPRAQQNTLVNLISELIG